MQGDERTWWVPGTPAPASAGPATATWQAELAGRLPRADDRPARAVELSFSLPGDGPDADLDELCDPVLSVLVDLGWFGGGPKALDTLLAARTHTVPTGCRVHVGDPPAAPALTAERPLLAGRHQGAPPPGRRAGALADWIGRRARAPHPHPVAVRLRMDAAWAAAGLPAAVPPVLDALWPLLGGTPEEPRDRLVEVLLVERLDARAAPEGGLEVTVWALTAPGRDAGSRDDPG